MATKKPAATPAKEIEKSSKTVKSTATKAAETADKTVKSTKKSTETTAEKSTKTTKKAAPATTKKVEDKVDKTASAPEKTTVTAISTAKKTTKKIAEPQEDFNLKYLELLDSYNSLKKTLELTKDENDKLQLQVIELQHINTSLTTKISSLTTAPTPVSQNVPQTPNADTTAVDSTLLNSELAYKTVRIKTETGNYLCALGGKLIVGTKRPNSDGYLFKVVFRPKTSNTFLCSVVNDQYLKVDRETKQVILAEEANKYSRVLLKQGKKGGVEIVSKEFENGNWFIDDVDVKIGKKNTENWSIEVVQD
jgi:hypothetical protein